MPAIQTLVTGLAGAIGCHYHGASHTLYFVEFGGRLSRYRLLRQPEAQLFAGTVLLRGTWELDLETGAQPGAAGTADIWWRQRDSVRRQMEPRNGAMLAHLGTMTPAQFAALDATALQALEYAPTPIVGDNNAANRLTPGTVFAVRTGSGHYAKLRVVSYGYDIRLAIVSWRLAPAYQVLGTGYSQPEDVKVSADGMRAYITERTGALLRVSLTGTTAPNRAAAAVVANGLTAPHQISLHEDRGFAYVVEFGASAQLVRVALAGGAKTPVAFGLNNAIGLAVTADHRFAYVSEQAAGGGRVRRVDLGSGTVEPVIGGFTSPFMLCWADASESALLLAERDPANRVALIDLGVRPVVSRVVASPVPARPSSVAVALGTRLLVCCDTALAGTELAEGAFSGSGPLLMGIGHVPVDRITGGYADTSADAGYFFSVKDCPFGGNLPLQFNHVRARALGAAFYKVLIDGAEVNAPWADYRWSSATNRFEVVPVLPDAANFYAVRGAGELWFNAWLGLVRDTGDLPNGLHTFQVRLFRADRTPVAAPGITTSVQLMIDNTRPTALLRTIFHDTTPVGACGIVTTGPDRFRFEIDASDPQQHLLSWSLTALWGDNKSALVAHASYAAHASPTRRWAGTVGIVPPVPPLPVPPPPGTPPAWAATVPGDPTSSRCAHTFVLEVWDRVINGYGYLHRSSAHKSITIMLP